MTWIKINTLIKKIHHPNNSLPLVTYKSEPTFHHRISKITVNQSMELNERIYHSENENLVEGQKNNDLVTRDCNSMIQHSVTIAEDIYFDKNQLEVYIIENIDPTQYLCKQCTYKSSRRDHIESHVKYIHLKINDFQCSDCNKAFSQKVDLNKHRKSVHSKIRDLKCCDCSKVFSHDIYLRRHRKSVHLKIRDFHCNDCDNAFSEKGT